MTSAVTPSLDGPKLLLDQNLSHRLIPRIVQSYPGSMHVQTVGLAAASDEVVWTYAREQGLIITSKDADFHQRSFVRGAPPKVVWIRRGNCTTKDIETILQMYRGTVCAFARDETGTFLVLV